MAFIMKFSLPVQFSLSLCPDGESLNLCNRTGRIFTGDTSARFLFKALHKEGFANQSTSESTDDGLKLHGCYMTAAVLHYVKHHGGFTKGLHFSIMVRNIRLKIFRFSSY